MQPITALRAESNNTRQTTLWRAKMREDKKDTGIPLFSNPEVYLN
jgi:hypothetical protein